MSQTQIRFDERIEPVDRHRCAPRLKRTLHEPQMNGADDVRAVRGELEERAMPQADVCIVVPLWRKTEFVEHTHEPVDRLRSIRRIRLRATLSQPAAPCAARLERSGAGVGFGRHAESQNLREHLMRRGPPGFIRRTARNI